jgi:hypothetical protein
MFGNEELAVIYPNHWVSYLGGFDIDEDEL